jgi:NhaA family Na+:H+ antiporter
MKTVRGLSRTFTNFFESEKASGIVLILCTMVSLLLANSILRVRYLGFWQTYVGGLSVAHWVNDGLMAVFFLFVGLEIERELYNGELAEFKNALLPIFAALGGLITPALIHFSLNRGTATQAGVAIPMATDIAFALGVLALLGNRVPASLKVFVVAFAVIDDLCAVVIIAIFYTAELSVLYLGGALVVWTALILLNRLARVMSLAPYLIGGALMWFLTLKSGVHATIAGVLLAFAIPFSRKADDVDSPSHRLEHSLHKPVAFVILPLFALANTGVTIGADWTSHLTSVNSLGIIGGLIAGKSLGITLLSYIAVKAGICGLPQELNWKYVFGAGLLGGIGFTMSIFITNLAFSTTLELINASKLAILLASLTAGVIGLLWLAVVRRSAPPAGHAM